MTDSKNNAKGSIDDTVRLNIPGTRGDVRVSGAERIFYKVLVDGQPVKRKGGWPIPARGGDTKLLKARGFIPGFQTLYTEEDGELLRMGEHVTLAERMAMFLPVLLIIFSFPGLVLALVLFFMNVMAVKNPVIPKAARIGVAILNTVAGAFVLLLLPSVLN